MGGRQDAMKATIAAVALALLLAGTASCGEKDDASVALHPITGTVPGGRSVHLSSPERLQELKDALTKAGVRFHSATFRDQEYVVWAFDDTEAVIAAWTFEPEAVKMFRHAKREFHDQK